MALRVEEVDVHYKDFQALWKVSLEVEKGKIVSVIGANGSGKSTLLNTIAGIYRPTRGKVEFKGGRLTGLKRMRCWGWGSRLCRRGGVCLRG